MNWFKKQGDRFKVAGDRDTTTQPLSPITNHLSPNSPFRAGGFALAAMGAILGLVPVNGYAWFLRIEGGLYKAARAIWQRISPQRLSFPFLVTFFNGHVCSCAGGQQTSTQKQWRELSGEQRALTLGIFPPFRMNENTSQETYKAHNSQKNFGSDREFFKKITGQTYCKDSGPDGVNAFRDKFSSRVVNDRFHRFNDNMIGNVCQTQFSQFSRSFRAFSRPEGLTRSTRHGLIRRPRSGSMVSKAKGRVEPLTIS